MADGERSQRVALQIGNLQANLSGRRIGNVDGEVFGSFVSSQVGQLNREGSVSRLAGRWRPVDHTGGRVDCGTRRRLGQRVDQTAALFTADQVGLESATDVGLRRGAAHHRVRCGRVIDQLQGSPKASLVSLPLSCRAASW